MNAWMEVEKAGSVRGRRDPGSSIIVLMTSSKRSRTETVNIRCDWIGAKFRQRRTRGKTRIYRVLHATIGAPIIPFLTMLIVQIIWCGGTDADDADADDADTTI